MNTEQFVGLAGIPLVRSVVKAFGISLPIINVLLSLVVAILVNVAVAYLVNSDWKSAIAVGLLTGFGANLYNDFRDATKLD
jgi:fluoride ion exporter CrcB/FEX